MRLLDREEGLRTPVRSNVPASSTATGATGADQAGKEKKKSGWLSRLLPANFEWQGWRDMFDDVTGGLKNNPYPKNFKYQIRAPWPQPSPLDPRFPNTILHVPLGEYKEFLRVIVTRYINHLKYDSPKALWHAIQNPALEPVTDVDFDRQISTGPFARMFVDGLDPQDKNLFADILALHPADTRWCKNDCSIMDGIEMQRGMQNGISCIALLKDVDPAGNGGEAYHVVAVAVDGEVFTPNDGDAWELSKYFMLAAAANVMIMGLHPRIHFPADSINALSKTLLPESHVLGQLLEPHHYMQLPLDYAVLYINKSVAHNNPNDIYTPFPFTRQGFLELTGRTFEGVPGNRTYPDSRYRVGEPQPHGEYGRFLQAYHDVILAFTTRVLKDVSPDDSVVRHWANTLAHYLPGFPDAEAIFKDNMLARVTATYIHNAAVAHASDHYVYGNESINRTPLRIRAKPPRRGEKVVLDRRKAIHRTDLFRHYLARVMYFKPTVLRPLLGTQYRFARPEQQEAARLFMDELQALDKNLPTRRFVPLPEMSASIQY